MKRLNLKRAIFGISLATLIFTSLAGCVVYDPAPYPNYYYRERYYSRPYYYGGYYRSYRPYYYRNND